MEETVVLRDRIHSIMCRLSQNVSTTECLMNSLRTKEDLDEVRGKMTEAATSIEILIPLLQTYMALDEPKQEESKRQWWLERERINRDLENALKNFHMIHLVLDNCNNVTTAKSMAKNLLDLKPHGTKSKPLPEYKRYDFSLMEKDKPIANRVEIQPENQIKPLETINVVVEPSDVIIQEAAIVTQVNLKNQERDDDEKPTKNRKKKKMKKRRTIVPCTIL